MRYCLICKRCYDDEVSYCEADGAQTAGIMPGSRTLDGKYEVLRLLGQGGVAVPDHIHRRAGGALDGDLAVAVAVGAGEDDDGGFHVRRTHRERVWRAGHPGRGRGS